MRMQSAALLVSLALLPACSEGGGGGGAGDLPAGLPGHFAFGLGNGPADIAWMTGSGVAWDYRYPYFLLDTNRPHVVDYAAAGVIAVLFGATEDGTTHYDDHRGDGVTNGAATGQVSTLPNDDGGFLRTAAGAYYSTGPVHLSY